MSGYDNGNVIRLFRTMCGLSGQALLRSDAKLVPQMFYDGDGYSYAWCIHNGRGGQFRVPNAKEQDMPFWELPDPRVAWDGQYDMYTAGFAINA